MSKATMDSLRLQLDVLALAFTALARAVPAESAARVWDDLRQEVVQRLDGVALSAQADQALAANLGRMMIALERPRAT